MKLKLFSIDFAKDSISFKVPNDIMQTAVWSNGYADIDLSQISDIETEQGNTPDSNTGEIVATCGKCGLEHRSHMAAANCCR